MYLNYNYNKLLIEWHTFEQLPFKANCAHMAIQEFGLLITDLQNFKNILL